MCHVYVHACMYVCMRMRMCMYACMCVSMHVCVHACMCVHVCLCACEDIKCRLAKAFLVFGCLRHPIFANLSLSLGNKRVVHQATVIAVLLCGAETWTLMVYHVRHLTVFHNHCIRTILGVSKYDQWQQHLTSAVLRDKFAWY